MIRSYLSGAFCVGLALLLGVAVLALPKRPEGLAKPALDELERSGVTNPVTAVLLNYRGYDTLLEVAVLLTAAVGVWALRQGRWRTVNLEGRPQLPALLRGLLPVLIIVAAYLLWIGAFAPGGAFQGGALLGGALVLALLAGWGRRIWTHEASLRTGLGIGLAVFTGATAAGFGITGHLLGYPAGQAGTWILVIESAALISIGLTLGALYLGGAPPAADAPTSPAASLANQVLDPPPEAPSPRIRS